MRDVWLALATGVLAAASALCGVAFTNRHSLRLHRELLREEAAKGQRELIAEAAIAGRAWADMQMLMVPVMGKASFDDLAELADTDTGLRLAEATRRLEVALTRAKLFLMEPELRNIAEGLSDFHDAFAETVNGPILTDHANSDHVLAGLQQVARFRTTIRQLEQQAVERLSSPAWYHEAAR